MYSAYPSISHNGTGAGGSLAESLGITPGSPTATILGGGAVGVLGIALIAGAVVYFKKGGSVSGLIEKVKENKGLITKAASMLPLTEEQKAKLDTAVNDPTALLPKEAQQAIEVIQHAKEYQTQAISLLPISDTQKAQVTSAITSVENKIVKKIAETPSGVQVTKLLKATDLMPVTPTPTVIVATPSAVSVASDTVASPPIVKSTESVTIVHPETSTTDSLSPPISTPSLVALHINEEDVEAVQAFLKEKLSKEEKAL